MSQALDRLGRACARHHWRTISLWIIAVLAFAVLASGIGGSAVDNFRLPGSDAQRAQDILQRDFRSESGSSASLVFHARHGLLTDQTESTAIRDTLARVAKLEHVSFVSSPVATGATSSDNTIARVEVRYSRSTADLGRDSYDQLRSALAPARQSGLQVEIGGPIAVWEQSSGSSEWIGVLVAMVVLAIVFGSLLAMGLALALAISALVAGQMLVVLLSGVVDVPSSTPQLVLMIGLGVALDYSLFVISRYLDRVRAGETPEAAAGHAAGTAGVAVLFAGSTVIIAICGLVISGIWAIGVMGFAVAIVVAVTVVAALTLLPALLGLLGHHANVSGVPFLRRSASREYEGARRWAHVVVRHPVVAAVSAVLVLLVVASPVLGLHLGQTDAGTQPTSTSQRRAFDLLARGFGPGFNGPLLVVADGPGVRQAANLEQLARAIATDHDVAAVSEPLLNRAGTVAVVEVFPRTSPHSARTEALVLRLRTTVLPTSGTNDVHALVGGQTAAFVDMANQMQSRLPVLIAVVVALSFLLLMVGFRSIVVPLKAAVMNVLSIGVGYGVLVAVFQWGWGKGLIGLSDTVPIVSWVPLLMFAILFGLSMDYEVFLISAIRNSYHSHRDNRRAVVEGLSSTARIITAAALIMLAVFGAFVFDPDPTVKMVGLGLAVAILVDATIVRMVLVPAAMILLGDANWWLPRWLDRILPTVDFEGEETEPLSVCQPAPEPTEDAVELPRTQELVASGTSREPS